MKALLVTVSGFVLTLAVFGGGAYTAIFFTNAEPVPVWTPDDSTRVWTDRPVSVSVSEQDLERLPSTSPTESSVIAREVAETPLVAGAEPQVDATTTASVDVTDPVDLEQDPAQTSMAAHIEWCSERYRSYQPETNSYTSYSGDRRQCISPHDGGAGIAAPGEDGERQYVGLSADRPYVGYAAKDEEEAYADLPAQHIESCFARYQSYRPEDNSYQPYSGGPRRQCR